MRLDSALAFVPLNYNQSIVAGLGISVPSINTIDMLGLGVGVSPGSQTGGSGGVIIGSEATNFGTDQGIGGFRPELEVVVGTAFATSDACTLNVQLQAAADAGSPTWLPLTWDTIVETGPIAVANLTANTVIARFPYLPAFPANLRPRFLRLNFAVPAAEQFTAGTILCAVVTLVRDDQANRFASRNYSVA
jgi:hypothetical protein